MKKLTAILASIVFLFVLVSPTFAASPRTSTNYKMNSGSGGVDFFPYLSGDKRLLTVDFQSANLDRIEYVNYNINYDTSDAGSLRGAEGTMYPERKDYQYYNRVPFLRRVIVLGTCSKNICMYNQKPRNFKVTVKTKFKNSNQVYTKTYSID